MEDLLNIANQSQIDQITMILDCCYSGKLGETSALQLGYSSLREGISVIAASGSDERAFEKLGSGVFTFLLCAALSGGASDLLGNITSASVYSHIDQALTAWQHQPLFKASLSRLTPLRTVTPPLPPAILRKLAVYFPSPEAIYPLDPSYEPDTKYKPPGVEKHPANEEIFSHLQKFRDAHLLVPEGEDLFWAAIRKAGCRLTLLGQQYWKLAKEGRI